MKTAFNKSCLLDDLDSQQEAVVVGLQSDATTLPPELMRRLTEIGFLPGERVRVLARGFPGGNPLAVRVGTSTFALRRIEARCIQVVVTTPTSTVQS